MRIKLTDLAPKLKKITKPAATAPQNRIRNINKRKPPSDPVIAEIRELLAHTEPRNIPQCMKDRFKPLSKTMISQMIQEVSKSLKSQNELDRKMLEVTLKVLQELLQDKNQAQQTKP